MDEITRILEKNGILKDNPNFETFYKCMDTWGENCFDAATEYDEMQDGQLRSDYADYKDYKNKMQEFNSKLRT